MKRTSKAIAIVASLLRTVVAMGCSDSNGPAGTHSITVTAVTPATGLLAGGTSVTITGTNFVDVTSATIGGNELGNLTVVTTTERGQPYQQSRLGRLSRVVAPWHQDRLHERPDGQRGDLRD